MEMLAELAMNVQQGDHFQSLDRAKDYRHMRLHLAKRDWFICKYDGRYYHRVVLIFW